MATMAIPETPESFGNPLGADAAVNALDANDTHDDDDAGGQLAVNSQKATIPADAAAVPSPSKPAKATKARATGPQSLSLKQTKRRPRAELAAMVVAEREQVIQLSARVDELTRQVAVSQVVGAEVIDESVKDLVGGVIDLADGAAQLLARQHAKAVELDAEERERLVTLAARVAKLKAPAAVEHSPMLALGVCVASVALGKFIAYKLAAAEQAKALTE